MGEEEEEQGGGNGCRERPSLEEELSSDFQTTLDSSSGTDTTVHLSEPLSPSFSRTPYTVALIFFLTMKTKKLRKTKQNTPEAHPQ